MCLTDSNLVLYCCYSTAGRLTLKLKFCVQNAGCIVASQCPDKYENGTNTQKNVTASGRAGWGGEPNQQLRTDTKLTYLLTYLRTACSKVLLEKLTGFQLIKKLPAFYRTGSFITSFSSALF